MFFGVLSVTHAQLDLYFNHATTVECGSELRVDIQVRDFNELVGLQFSVQWEDEALTVNRIENIHPGLPSSPIINTPANSSIDDDKLSFDFFDTNNPGTTNGTTSIADDEILFTIYFDVTENFVDDNLDLSFKDTPLAREALNEQLFNIGITSANSIVNVRCSPLIVNKDEFEEAFGSGDLPPGVIDPCTCRNNVPELENGETSDNGLFSDEVLIVTATSGDQWEVLSAANAQPLPFRYNPDNTLQPEDLMRVMPGDPFAFVGSFIHNGEVFYIYRLQIIHQDGMGFSMRVRDVSGNYASILNIDATCYYPGPFIENIRPIYTTQCDDPITIVGAELNGAAPEAFELILMSTGTGAAVIDMVSGSDCQNTPCDEPEITFTPSNLGVGTYKATFFFDAGEAGIDDENDPGCETEVVACFEIVEPPVNLICNNNIQVSLNENCETVLEADGILEGDQENYDLFDIVVMNQAGENVGNVLGEEHIGQTLTVKVEDFCSGNSCWGTITVEDKLPPQFDCPDPITVACTRDLDTIDPPIATDNCDTDIDPVLINEIFTSLDCDGNDLVGRVVRTWEATDDSGNVSDRCEQVINLQKFTLDDVDFPENLDNEDLPALDCDNANTDPSNTGFPLLDGGAIDGGDFCRMAASFSDDIIDACGGSFKILRTWTVYDWCEPLLAGDNPRMHVQVIKVEDDNDPVLTCPPSFSVGAENLDCTVNVDLPAAAIFDLCSDFEVVTQTPSGLIDGNGGTSPALSVGMHTIIYRATDECGNTASCSMNVTIADSIEPVPVCSDDISTTLNASGASLVNAISFDDGSYDNCTDVTFSVRRMDAASTFTESVSFTCDDIGAPITVILRVRDEADNENFCMVGVEVQDKADPVLTCPEDIAIDCTLDPEDLSITGQATVADACTIILFDHTDVSNSINDCGTGTITRAFRAMDSGGNESNCIQFISVSNQNTLFDGNDIDWPEDYDITNQCGVSTNPDDLPEANGRPIILNERACSQVVATFEDEILYLSEPGDTACFKLLRTWIVIDWCQYNPNATNPVGRFEYVQTIKVLDQTAPTVTCPSNVTVDVTSANSCLSDAFNLPLPTANDCSTVINIDIDGDLGSSTNVSPLPPGIYDVAYTISDGCGNATSCAIEVTVRDAVGPQGVCESLSTIPMAPTGMIDINALQFVQPVSLLDNCTATEDIEVAFSTNVGDDTRTYTCDSIGMREVELFAMDEAGNWKPICRASIDIQSNGNCMGRLISGGILTEDGLEVENVNVTISGNASNTVTTSADGVFAFSGVPLGGDYTIIPEKDVQPLNGVSTFDLVLMKKHILDVEPLDSPYKRIAADVNKSGTITTFDMIQIRKLILGVHTTFADNDSWRFVRADHEFINPENPFVPDFPEIYNINDLPEDVLDADFIGIKVGDVSGDAIPNNLTTDGEGLLVYGTRLTHNGSQVEERTEEMGLNLIVENEKLSKGEEHLITFTSDNFEHILGFQTTLSIDVEKVELLEIESGLLYEDANFGLTAIDEGVIRISWNEANAENVTSDQVLFGLKVKAKQNIQIDEVLSQHYSEVAQEAYRVLDNEQTVVSSAQPEMEVVNVNLGFSNGTGHEVILANENVQLFQNQPNPFRESTQIGFYLPKAAKATLTIYDFSGRVLRTMNGEFDKGYQQFNIQNIKETGFFYYQLETLQQSLTRKMSAF